MTEAEALLLEMWWHHAITHEVGDIKEATEYDGQPRGRWPGGLSVLESAEVYLRRRELIDEHGTPVWDEEVVEK